MKLKFLTVAVALVAMTSCGSKSDDSSADAKGDKTENTESSYADYEGSNDSSSDSYDSNDSDFEDDDDSSASSSDVDDMLKEYENFVDNYVSLIKKAAKGDMSVMTKMSDYMESAESLSRKLENCSGKMSASQMKRYTKITSKFSEAAAELAGGAINATEMMENAMGSAADMLDALDGFDF
ncbi:MAG: hypothetical protein HDS69_10460 [Bacteroidales bacterium]|nr:hypothetical protein [Bacteroidales bacterium]